MVGLQLCINPASCTYTEEADVQSKRIPLVLCTLINLGQLCCQQSIETVVAAPVADTSVECHSKGMIKLLPSCRRIQPDLIAHMKSQSQHRYGQKHRFENKVSLMHRTG